jgi:hypothetical protein
MAERHPSLLPNPGHTEGNRQGESRRTPSPGVGLVRGSQEPTGGIRISDAAGLISATRGAWAPPHGLSGTDCDDSVARAQGIGCGRPLMRLRSLQ